MDIANTSAVYARIDAQLKENAEAILAQLGITPSANIQMNYSQVVLHNGLPFSARIPAKAPTAMVRMTQEQLDAELRKGVESFNKGSFTADEIDQALAKEFGICWILTAWFTRPLPETICLASIPTSPQSFWNRRSPRSRPSESATQFASWNSSPPAMPVSTGSPGFPWVCVS